VERSLTTEIRQSQPTFSAVPGISQPQPPALDGRTFEVDSGACQTMSILLVDDEEDLRRLLCRALRQDGYRVFEAGSGEDALSVAARHGKELRLLVTDLRMPGMNGRELAERLTREWPHIPVLYISGFSEVSPDPGAPFLRKPFRLEVLKREIKRLMAPPDARRKPPGSEGAEGDSGSRRKRG
jgi:two-component system cell cycle sensor histidine kinase/response regulator CckA